MNREIFSELMESFDKRAIERRTIALINQNLRFAKPAPGAFQKPSGFAAHTYFGYICPEYGGDMMIVVPLAEAKNNLSKLVDDAAAGQIITIAKHGRALARLVPVGKACGKRIGAMKGKLVLPDDFDAPLPDEMLDAFEGAKE
jgi:prevent-host-death family protein